MTNDHLSLMLRKNFLFGKKSKNSYTFYHKVIHTTLNEKNRQQIKTEKKNQQILQKYYSKKYYVIKVH